MNAEEEAALRTLLDFVETEAASAYVPDDSEVVEASETLRAMLGGRA